MNRLMCQESVELSSECLRMHHLKSKLSKFSEGGPPDPPPHYNGITLCFEFHCNSICLANMQDVPLQIIINIREPSLDTLFILDRIAPTVIFVLFYHRLATALRTFSGFLSNLV